MKQSLMTRATYLRLKDEIDELTRRKAEMSVRIAHDYESGGGWHDNALWEESQRQQGLLFSRIKHLKSIFTCATFIDDMTVNLEQVGVGTKVTILESEGESKLTILGPADSDFENGIISFDSDLFKAIESTKVGDVIYFRGDDLTILKIQRWDEKD